MEIQEEHANGLWYMRAASLLLERLNFLNYPFQQAFWSTSRYNYSSPGKREKPEAEQIMLRHRPSTFIFLYHS